MSSKKTRFFCSWFTTSFSQPSLTKMNSARLLSVMIFLKKESPKGFLKRTKETVAPKKINSSFILKILKSHTFKILLMKFLKEKFIKESLSETSKKLHKMCMTWQGIMLKKDLTQFEMVCKSIEQDGKTKLPWTLTEISSAIDAFVVQFPNWLIILN